MRAEHVRTHGRTHGERTALHAQAALKDEVAAVAEAGRGNRNNRLNTASLKLGQLVGPGRLGEQEVEDALMQAAEDNGLVADKGGRPAVRKTIRSGLEAGMLQPPAKPPGRHAARQRPRPHQRPRARSRPTGSGSAAPR
jgi:hypothetical protein